MSLIIAIIFLLIFLIKIIVFLLLSPDTVGTEKDLKISVKNLWAVVKICQSAYFGKPTLVLVPAEKSVEMRIDFFDDERVSLSIPLLQKEQRQEKANYLKIFSKHNLISFEASDQVTAYLNRKDENLGELIAHIYKEVFDADSSDTIKFTAKTLITDLRLLISYENKNYQLSEDHEFVSTSAKYKDKSISKIQVERILDAAEWLLYPPIILLSYKFYGLPVMCWMALIFLGFFAAHKTINQKKSITNSWGNILSCTLLSVSIATHNTDFLQAIPAALGISMVVIFGGMALGFIEPKPERRIQQKQKNPREFSLMMYILMIGGFGLFFYNQWACNRYSLESWILFFAFARVELITTNFQLYEQKA